MLRAAGLQHLEILLLEVGQPVGIGGIKRVHQPVAEGIGIDVEGRMHEMRDVGPEGLVARHEGERRPEALGLHRHPQRVDVLGRQLALGAGRVQLAFEVIERDLPHHGVDHVLDLAGEEGLAFSLGFRAIEQLAEGQHLAEDRGGLGQRQRRVGQHLALTRRQHLMHAMAKLVRQRHHVARLAEVIQHHIGVHRGHRRMGEGAGRLAGLDARVDPALLEEGLRDLGHLRREAGIGGQHRVLRLVPQDLARRLGRQRGVAVPDLERLEAQPFRLQRVIAVAEPRIGGDHGVAQRLDHLGLDVVRQVPRRLRRRHLAPAVLDLLLLGQRVVHAREDLDVVGEDLGERMGRGLALRPVVVGHQRRRRLEAQRLALDLEGQRGGGLVEEAIPGGGADDRLVVQEFLELVGQLIGLHRPHPVEDRLVAGHRRIGEDGLIGRVVDAVELEREEDERRGEGGDPVLRVRQELGARAVDGVLIIAQPGIGHDPPGRGLDRFVAVDAFGHRGGIERGELALVIGGEACAQGLERGHVAGKFRRIGGGVEIAQVPVRQVAEAARRAPRAGVGIEKRQVLFHGTLICGCPRDRRRRGAGSSRAADRAAAGRRCRGRARPLAPSGGAAKKHDDLPDLAAKVISSPRK
ncbi:hypothetical protein SDC9_16898 [bioreactor metagenome]|uniref:Uncharacterized protein n=1 Tax=bioreactor metagenome TaxID=1076179 RepID=A0A644TXF1_9ZZZZ